MKVLKLVSLFFVGLKLVFCVAVADESQLKLSRDDKIEILLPVGATPAEAYAAEELSTYLGRILDKEMPVRRSDEIASGVFPIIVGWHDLNAAFQPELLNEEESVVLITPKSIHLFGGKSLEVDENGIPLHDRGTLYAVYDFLEMLGVRWYRPEPWGEHVPSLEAIELSIGEVRTEPVYKYRYGIAHYNTTRGQQPIEWLEKHFMAKKWAIRNRMNTNLWREKNIPGQDVSPYGGSYEVDFSHAYYRLVPHERYFNEHPEYFALINGRRSTNPKAQLCLGNPELQGLVFNKILEMAKRRPNQDIFSLDPNDTDLWCECELCVAMDNPDIKAPYGKGAGGVSMSDRVMRFNSIIARRLAEVMPGKSVGSYAYWQYTEPPSEDLIVEPNVVVSPAAFASTYSDYSRKLDDPRSDQNKRFLAVMEGYYNRGVRLFSREYWSYYVWPGPMPVIPTMVDRLTNYHSRFEVEGVYSETHPCWGPQGMILYFYTWLLCNPYGDVEKEKDLYYRNFYGPGAESMRLYHERLDEVGQSGKYWGSGGNRFDELLTIELMKELDTYIGGARRLIGNEEPYNQRLAGVEAGHQFAWMAVEFRRAIAKKDYVTAGRQLKAMEELFYSFPDGSVFSSRATRADGSLRLPGVIVNYKKMLGDRGQLESLFFDPVVAQDLNQGWFFKPDPDVLGIKNEWALKGEYRDTWPEIKVGKAWQDSGYADYSGLAWYRKSLVPPTVGSGKRLFLFLQEVRGDVEIFLNGRSIYSRSATESPHDPVYVDITDLVLAGRENDISIGIRDQTRQSGLIGSVLLISTSGLLPPE